MNIIFILQKKGTTNYTSEICLTKMFIGKNLSYEGGRGDMEGGGSVPVITSAWGVKYVQYIYSN